MTGRSAVLSWCAVTLVSDQLTKAAATALGPGRWPWIQPVRNGALSLGIADTGRWVEVGLMVLGIVAATVVVHHRVERRRLSAWAAGLIVGGATANLADRLVLGAVRDFLAVGPVVLNVADLAVVVGLASAIAHRRGTQVMPNERRCSDDPNPDRTARAVGDRARSRRVHRGGDGPKTQILNQR